MINNVSFENVKLNKGFWLDRYLLNKNISIKAVYERLVDGHRFDSLRFHFDPKESLHIFFDSDFAKWVEAVSYVLIKDRKAYPEYEKLIDEIAVSIEKNNINGYFDSYFIQKEPQNIFKKVDCHELYCLGHMIEGAIAYDKATGKHSLLNSCYKAIDYVIDCFITKKTAAFHAPGHEEIELALIKLYYYTKNKKYLDLALHFINERGKYNEPLNNYFSSYYNQNEKPLREMDEANGHAVRATYIYIAMVEAGLIANDDGLLKATQKIFDNITNKKMYITGGIGSSSSGECFTVNYDLPNLLAYSESCASIGLALFGLSMQKTKLDSKYADLIERVLYNSMLSSTSLSGDEFFYENPLEINLTEINKDVSIVEKERRHLPLIHRKKFFDCFCCPPNINRIFARIGDFIYSEFDNSIVINQFISSKYKSNDREVKIVTNFPKSGHIKISAKGYDYIYIRKPNWCDNFKTKQPYELENGYLKFKNSQEIFIIFTIPTYFVQSNNNVKYNIGKVAIMHGPIVYCAEAIDNIDSPLKLFVNSKTKFNLKYDSNSYIPVILCSGFKNKETSSLYQKYNKEQDKISLKFIPYYMFANRENCDMAVFMNIK